MILPSMILPLLLSSCEPCGKPQTGVMTSDQGEHGTAINGRDHSSFDMALLLVPASPGWALRKKAGEGCAERRTQRSGHWNPSGQRFVNGDMMGVRKAAPDVARAFGLRGLDPALALRTAEVRRSLDVERTSARERCKTFHAPCPKRKSGSSPRSPKPRGTPATPCARTLSSPLR